MSKNNTPAKQSASSLEVEQSSSSDIAHFLEKAKVTGAKGNGRLIFAMDATMSRQPTWDQASQIQASMFEIAGKKTDLSVQLVYFRGYGECRASKWVSNPNALLGLMTGIQCKGGMTQIGKVLKHASKESSKKKVAALVYIGDAMEEEIDVLAHHAGKLGVQGVKAFMFQEGHDSACEAGFREIARLSTGAYMKLSPNSPKELEMLLSAVAAYASGGYKALAAKRDKTSQALIEQLKP